MQQQAAAANVQWQQLAELVLQHLLHLPLAAHQPDLVAALADPEPCARLEFLLLYYPVGEVRVEVECRLVPASAAGAATAAISAAAAAGAGAGAAVCSSPSPYASPSPRAGSGRSSPAAAAAGSRPGTPVGSEAAAAAVAGAAAAAAAAAAVGGVSGVTPGPGWGGVTVYHKYVIRETAEFVLSTHMPGEPQAVQEAARGAFKQELNRYSTLHKLLVQQAPRASVAGLMSLLQAAGFAGVGLATQLETYFVGGNAFPGFRSVITFEM
uniref:Uncharacterized protein n=1 Tax=Tetradesmus obliquus TaxID=3088 RepID=A0A383V6Q1_TETOB|eukprot:jgi/Sobl393_1/8990/SZX60811.1